MSNEIKAEDEQENITIPKEVQEALEKLPNGATKSRTLHQISESIQISGQLRPHIPYEDKMTTENLSAIIENSDKQSQREFELRKSNNKYKFSMFVIGLVVFLILILLLKDNPDLLLKILLPIITFVAGYWGGHGQGYKKGKSDTE